MKKLILFLLLIPVVMAQQKILVLDIIVYDNDSATIKNITTSYGEMEKTPIFDGTHKLELLSFDRSVLYIKDIALSFEVRPDYLGAQSAPIKYPKMIVYSKIPYSAEYRYLRLSKGGKQIFETDIGELLCNFNNICEGAENYLSCSDCGDLSKDGFCYQVKDNICDGDCKRGLDPDCNTVKTIQCGDGICEVSENCELDCKKSCISDGICDQNCNDPDCKPAKSSSNIKNILGIIFFLLIIGIVIFFYIKLKNKRASENIFIMVILAVTVMIFVFVVILNLTGTQTGLALDKSKNTNYELANNFLLALLGSPCLSVGDYADYKWQLPTIGFLDEKKLNIFDNTNQEVYCTDNFQFLYKLQVIDLVNNRKWNIGLNAPVGDQKITLSYPVSIKYNATIPEIHKGNALMTAYFGSVPSFIGGIKHVCATGENLNSQINTDYPMKYNNSMNSLLIGKNEFFPLFGCYVDDFTILKGTHLYSIRYQNSKVSIK